MKISSKLLEGGNKRYHLYKKYLANICSYQIFPKVLLLRCFFICADEGFIITPSVTAFFVYVSKINLQMQIMRSGISLCKMYFFQAYFEISKNDTLCAWWIDIWWITFLTLFFRLYNFNINLKAEYQIDESNKFNLAINQNI